MAGHGPDNGLQDAWTLALDAITSVRDAYGRLRFYTERDLVWTLQGWLVTQCESRSLPFVIFNDFAAQPSRYRALSADLGVVRPNGPPVVLEFKYEPSHRRKDIGPGKFPVIGWDGVVTDAERVRRWVAEGLAGAGMAILVDEGATFAPRSVTGHRWPIAGVDQGFWEHWGDYGRQDLDVRVHRVHVPPPGWES